MQATTTGEIAAQFGAKPTSSAEPIRAWLTYAFRDDWTFVILFWTFVIPFLLFIFSNIYFTQLFFSFLCFYLIFHFYFLFLIFLFLNIYTF